MLLKKIISILTLLAVFFLLQLMIWQPHLWYIFVILAAVVVAIMILKLFDWRYRQKEFFIFLLTTLFIVISAFLFIFFIDSPSLRLTTIIIVSLLVGFYLNNIFLFLHNPQSYPPYSLENITTYLNIITYFLSLSSIYSLTVLLGISVLYLIIPAFILTGVLTLLTVWANKINLAKSRLWLFVLGLIMTELFWAVHYLPTNFFVNGLVLTIIYYMFVILGIDYLTKKIVQATVKKTLIIGCFMIILILVFAQWT